MRGRVVAFCFPLLHSLPLTIYAILQCISPPFWHELNEKITFLQHRQWPQGSHGEGVTRLLSQHDKNRPFSLPYMETSPSDVFRINSRSSSLYISKNRCLLSIKSGPIMHRITHYQYARNDAPIVIKFE